MPNKNKNKVNKNDPEALKLAGNKAFQNGNFTQAVEYYSEAIELDDKNHIYFSNRANANLELKKYDEVIKDCEASISLDPKFVKAYFRYAKALLAQDKPAEAKEKLN